MMGHLCLRNGEKLSGPELERPVRSDAEGKQAGDILKSLI